MNEAKTTWALVVGIDLYDSPELPRLAGAAADAVAAVLWLRRLGVPDGQIFLHAAPSAATLPALTALELPWAAAKEPDIWSSIARLRKVTGGTRLFVFLSGHGLYEPASGRLFLTQEAGPDAWSNLGMGLYAELFRSLGFARQFLFLDGCQNYPYPETARPTIQAAMHGGVTGYTAKPENTLAACYAAAQDQLAVEIGGRGAMMQFLLDGLDFENPCVEAVDLDFTTGERTVDLRQLLALCQEKVARDAAAQSPPVQQTPQLEAWGRHGSDLALHIVRLPELQTAALRVEVSPAGAGKEVKSLRISADEPPRWDLRLPSLPGDPVALPLTSRLPLGLQGYARCTLRPGAPWDVAEPRQGFEVNGDRNVVFELRQLQPPPAGPGVEPTIHRDWTLHNLGKSVFSAFNYREDAGEVGELELDSDEIGERSLAAPASGEEHPNLRLGLPAGGARALAGALAGQPAVWIGAPADAPAVPVWRGGAGAKGQVRSLAEVEARGGRERVEPGPVSVRVDLPWGSWSRTLRAPVAGEAVVELPAAVGQTPLRVALHPEPGCRGTVLLGVEGEAPAGSFRPGLYPGGVTPLVTALPGKAAWALTPGADFPEGGAGIAELAGGRWNLALACSCALAVDRSGGGLRVEPLSAVHLPVWDLLMGLGRLDSLSPAEALELTGGQQYVWLLRLAGVYAVYANPAPLSPGDLKTVFGNLDPLCDFKRPAPDLDLLRIALQSRGKTPSAKTLAALRPWAEAGSIPLLRWGVPLALRLLAKTGDPSLVRWREALAAVSRRLSLISTWTAWTGSSEGSA